MRTFDFSPLYRSTVGFDRLFSLLDQTSLAETGPAWPPYNVEKVGDDHYRITMAVAGFGSNEIEITQIENALLVSGQKQPEQENGQFLHRGIAARAFKQTFNLADYVKVTNASLENGLLTVDLVREVPEEMKPRRIEIARADSQKIIEHSKAA
ncbi:MAG: Hsp20 family protein [Microvirga sp.]